MLLTVLRRTVSLAIYTLVGNAEIHRAGHWFSTVNDRVKSWKREQRLNDNFQA
jgi:hypothetical protein